jgi:hypothetical protein
MTAPTPVPYQPNLRARRCSGAHFLGRSLRKQRHDVRLIAAQFVKPFVKSNKNDFVDAEAIAEAVERKNMRPPGYGSGELVWRIGAGQCRSGCSAWFRFTARGSVEGSARSALCGSVASRHGRERLRITCPSAPASCSGTVCHDRTFSYWTEWSKCGGWHRLATRALLNVSPLRAWVSTKLTCRA